MNSHLYANKMKEIADFLLSRPEFETAHACTIYQWYWSKKDDFLGAVKALGAGKKEWKTDDLYFVPEGCPEITTVVQRSAICRLVRPAEYDCEPLLSQEEEASIGT